MSLSQQEKELAKIFLAEFNVLHTYCQNLITTPASAPGLVPRIMAFKIPRFDHVNPEYLKKHQCLISLVNDDISHLERLLHTLDPAEHAEHSAVKAKAVIMLVERIQKSIRRSVGERPAK